MTREDGLDVNQIIRGDAFEVLETLPANSIHAIVTDPPYGLAFMGRDWDDFEPREYQAWCEEWAGLAMRVLKPGGHLLAFSGNRTHHRLFSGVEDAGFEVRDTLTWHYGSGFPKALDVSKAIDKRQRSAFVEQLSIDILRRAGVPDPEKTFYDWTEDGHAPGDEHWKTLKDGIDGSEELKREVIGRVEVVPGVAFETDGPDEIDVTAPATDAAREWDGWKTALKPASEFVVLARKPFSGTVAENVQAHGTGALNIDGCRIGTDEDLNFSQNWGMTEERGWNENNIPKRNGAAAQHAEGRYPANVIFDAEAAEALDREVGDVSTTGNRSEQSQKAEVEGTNWLVNNHQSKEYPHDTGGPSRYFYTSKATRAERTLNGRIDNAHPTVKPIDLMEWLVKLVTAEGQTVLDPFCGTGTTCRAAKNLGRDFIGIEKSEEWADVARVRCGLTPSDPATVRSDDAQSGIEAFLDD